ncbi:MAG: HAMP domain-containing histidine kinase [Cyclobacteriaceae bacterium]|jgi:signal transduction histidine kinase|nr:HAMP domain-containing histidine kinase [Cyclobacteriaceae bacterium]
MLRWCVLIIGCGLTLSAAAQLEKVENPYLDSIEYALEEDNARVLRYLARARQFDSAQTAATHQKLAATLAVTDSLVSLTEEERARFRLAEQEQVAAHQSLVRFFIMALVALATMLGVVVYYFWKQRTETLAALHAAERELTEAKARQERFFSVVARDLKTPVASLAQFAKTLRQTNDRVPATEYASLLNQLGAESAAVAQALENLAEWSVMQTGVFTLRKERFNVLPAIRETVDLLHYELTQKKIAVEVLVPDLLMVFADRALTALALRNLLRNAVRFSAPGSTVVFFGGRKNGIVTIGLRDFGKGMSAAEQARAFALKPAKDDAGQGTGLLFVSELAKASQGKITVESEEGKGSTFYLTLPQE